MAASVVTDKKVARAAAEETITMLKAGYRNVFITLEGSSSKIYLPKLA